MNPHPAPVQVNLDYASERDMARKLRVSLLLQPLATALFANSPFTEGQEKTTFCHCARRSGPTRTISAPASPR